MKRFFAVVLILCFLINIFTLVHSQTDERKDFCISRDFLYRIGVIKDGDTILEKSLSENVSRTEFAIMAARLYNNSFGFPEKHYFYDVTENTVGYAEINYLAQMNIVSGDTYGRFMRDEDIAFNDAVYTMLKIMGYKNFDNENYVFAIYRICSRFDLLSNKFLANKTSSVADISEMIYRLIEKPLLNMEYVYGNGNVKYGQSEHSLLNKHFDIYRKDGILECNGITNIYNDKIPDGKYIIVDGISVRISGREYSDFLGYNVNIYYKNVDSPELIALYEDASNYVIELDSTEIIDFKNQVYTYDNGDNKGSIKIALNECQVIYNCAPLNEFDLKKLRPNDATLKFIDNNDDGHYDVCIIKKYTSFVINRISKDDKNTVLYADASYNIPPIYIDVDTGAQIIKNGETIGIDDLVVGDTASALCVAQDGKLFSRELNISSVMVEGEITEKSINGEVCELTVRNHEFADKTYKLTDVYSAFFNNIKIVSNVTVYLTFDDKISDIEFSDDKSADLAYGYLINAALSEGMNDNVELLIYTELGRLKVYDTANRIKIDGESIKDRNGILEKIAPTGSVILQPIVFRLNEDRKVDYIDTPAPFSLESLSDLDNHLMKMGDDAGANSGRGLAYRVEGNTFSGRIVLDDNAIIFVIPENVKGAEEEEFAIIRKEQLIKDQFYQVKGYTTQKDSMSSNVIVITKNRKAVPSTNYTAVIEKINEAIDIESDKIIYSLLLFGVNGEKKYFTLNSELVDMALADSNSSSDITPHKIGVGDVIRYDINADGKIDTMVLAYDYSERKLLTDIKFGYTTYASVRTISAYVYDVNNQYMRIISDETSNLNNVSVNDMEVLPLNDFKKIVEVRKTGNGIIVEEAATEQIKSYIDNRSECSRVVVHMVSNKPIMLVIYND